MILPSDIEATLVQDQREIERSSELSRRAESPPAQVPGYAMLRSLGEGAYGSVWLACEENTGKHVAIKFYSHQRGLDWSLLSREVEKLAVLYTSRNIVRLIDVGWNSEPPYYIMEYLANGSLASHLASGPLPAHEAVRVAKSVLLALVHAHGSGILHCDLKPANVLLDNDFEPRLCDFGQSRLSNEQNPALGTLFYMAPEQADLQAVPDARWDVYGLGALLYHMLCGEPPYRTREIEEKIRVAENLEGKLAVYREGIRTNAKPLGLRGKSGIDRRLAEIVERCLQIDPQRRFPNAQAVLDTLVLRDRSRARRPLITLGIVGPSLLLAGMAWLIVGLLEAAGTDAGNLMTRRAVESDILSARIVAQSIKRDLDEREQEFIDIAERIGQAKDLEGLREAIAAQAITDIAKNQAVFAMLNTAREASDDLSGKLGLAKDFSWFVTDHRGVQKWRNPFRESESTAALTIGKNFAFRDYFHGRGEDYHIGSFPQDIEPIRSPHISSRFKPEGSGRQLFAVTVPIWDAGHQKVIGVLGRTIEIGSLLDEYGRKIFEDTDVASRHRTVSREIALVERVHGQLLDHTWFDKNEALMKAHPLSRAQIDSMRVADDLLVKFRRFDATEGQQVRRDFVKDENYIDPLSRLDLASPDVGGVWLAAFASVPGTDWVTIVQERRSAALEPVHEMKSRLTRNGWWALLASCGLIGLLWYFVGRALNDRTPRFPARRPVRRDSGSFNGEPTAGSA